MTDAAYSTTLAPRPLPILVAAEDAHSASPLLFRMAAVFLVLGILTLAFGVGDPRTLAGAGVWEKPSKFFLSLSLHMATVAWAMSLLPRLTRPIRWAAALLAGAAALEMLIIVTRAARGEASHFNVGTPLDGALYSLMGVGSLVLTGAPAFIGWRIWRQGRGTMREAAGMGLMLGAGLATLTAGYLSSRTGHWIGGDQTDATGVGVFGWSTTGGDLRVAHFIGLHTMQLLPFAALSGSRAVVWGTAAAVMLATAGAFAMAVMGIPLFRG